MILIFENCEISVEYSEELMLFLDKCVNSSEDHRVLFSYFGIEWPILYGNIYDKFIEYKVNS